MHFGADELQGAAMSVPATPIPFLRVTLTPAFSTPTTSPNNLFNKRFQHAVSCNQVHEIFGCHVAMAPSCVLVVVFALAAVEGLLIAPLAPSLSTASRASVSCLVKPTDADGNDIKGAR